MDKIVGMGRGGPWPGGRLSAKPSEIFRGHVYVSPFHEEDIRALAALIGAERVLYLPLPRLTYGTDASLLGLTTSDGFPDLERGGLGLTALAFGSSTRRRCREADLQHFHRMLTAFLADPGDGEHPVAMRG